MGIKVHVQLLQWLFEDLRLVLRVLQVLHQ